jgi:hypothetical protein
VNRGLLPRRGSRRPRLAVTLVVYVVLAFVWIYGVVNRGDWHDRIGYGIELPVVLVVYLVLAFFLARWWALLLPVATILVALPAGRNVHLDGDLEFVFFDPLYALAGWGRSVRGASPTERRTPFSGPRSPVGAGRWRTCRLADRGCSCHQAAEIFCS